MVVTLKKILVLYTPIGILLSALVFGLIVWLPILPFWIHMVLLGSHSVPEFLSLSKDTFGLALTDTTPLATTLNVCISVLTGTNLALLYYFYKQRYVSPSRSAVSSGIFGALFTTLGFGCASCGTFVVSLILSSLGGTMSLNGYQFQTVGISLQLVSVFLLIRQIRKPNVC